MAADPVRRPSLTIRLPWGAEDAHQSHGLCRCCINGAARVTQHEPVSCTTSEVPDSVKQGLEIIPVSRMDQVLTHALVRQPEAIEWDEPLPAKAPARTDDDSATLVAH